MTKKVLISWNELEDTLRENGTPEEPIAFMQDWFEAQPDVHAISKGTAYFTLGVIMGRIGGDKSDIEANLRCYLLAAKGLGLTKPEMEAVLKRYHPEWDLSLADWAIFDEVKRDE